MIYKKIFLKFCLVIVLMFVMLGQVVISFAQFDFDTPYEVSAEVPVVKNNFVKARKKAVKIALTLALEQGLREILRDDEFEQNRQEMQKMLKAFNKYVKSYRFLEAYDDSVEQMSRVKLEVNLFQEAISKTLSQRGVAAGLESVKQVVILINESSLSLDEESHFWEAVPISEIFLTRSFVESGIPVIRRNSSYTSRSRINYFNHYRKQRTRRRTFKARLGKYFYSHRNIGFSYGCAQATQNR